MNSIKHVSTGVALILFATLLGCAGNSPQETSGEHVSKGWITPNLKALVDESQGKATK